MSKPVQLVAGAIYHGAQKVNPGSDERARRARRDMLAGDPEAELRYLAEVRRAGGRHGELLASVEEGKRLRQETWRALDAVMRQGVPLAAISPTLSRDAGVDPGMYSNHVLGEVRSQIANASQQQLQQYMDEAALALTMGPLSNPPTAKISCDPCRVGAHGSCNSPAPGGLCGCWCNKSTQRFEGSVPAVARVPRHFLQGRRNPALLAIVGNEPYSHCPQCGGEGEQLGRLGSADWSRCRMCGWDYPTAAQGVPHVAPLAPEQQAARGKRKPKSKQQKKANPLLAVVGNPANLYAKGQAGFAQFHGKQSGRFLVFNKKTKKWREISKAEARRWAGPVAIGLGAVPETHYMVPEEWDSSKGPHYYVHEHPEGKEPLEVKDVETGLTSKLPTSPDMKITDWWRE